VQSQNNIQYMQEDEIDLRELFRTIMDHKKFIIIFTTIITMLAIVYSLLKTPTYEVNSLIEIGNYKVHGNSNTGDNRISLDDASSLVQKLNILYIDMFKNQKNRKSKIESISIPKKSKHFIQIKASGISNELAVNEIQKVVTYIRSKHQKILDDIKKQREMGLHNIDAKIDDIQHRSIPLLTKKIKSNEHILADLEKQIKDINKNLQKIENENPSLAALKLMEKQNLTTFMSDINNKLLEMKNDKDTLMTTTINKLKEDRLIAKSLMLPHNYKNSHIVGQIIKSDYPAKPKKKLIVIVAFVTGLILSIFIVFFMEFLKGMKNDD